MHWWQTKRGLSPYPRNFTDLQRMIPHVVAQVFMAAENDHGEDFQIGVHTAAYLSQQCLHTTYKGIRTYSTIENREALLGEMTEKERYKKSNWQSGRFFFEKEDKNFAGKVFEVRQTLTNRYHAKLQVTPNSFGQAVPAVRIVRKQCFRSRFYRALCKHTRLIPRFKPQPGEPEKAYELKFTAPTTLRAAGRKLFSKNMKRKPKYYSQPTNVSTCQPRRTKARGAAYTKRSRRKMLERQFSTVLNQRHHQFAGATGQYLPEWEEYRRYHSQKRTFHEYLDLKAKAYRAYCWEQGLREKFAAKWHAKRDAQWAERVKTLGNTDRKDFEDGHELIQGLLRKTRKSGSVKVGTLGRNPNPLGLEMTKVLGKWKASKPWRG
jgi:hypothetical protein